MEAVRRSRHRRRHRVGIVAQVDRLDHGIFGYGRTPPELFEAICERMLRQQGWAIEPEVVWPFEQKTFFEERMKDRRDVFARLVK